MTFQEFAHLARLHVIGALDPAEAGDFAAGRRQFGERAECFISESRRLNAALALSLQPLPPDPATRENLLRLISKSSRRRRC